MTPPIEAFPLSSLPERAQITPKGKRRKKPIELEKCALRELVQYKCWIDGDEKESGAVVRCMPVVRLFRRCADGLMVETTTWERRGAKEENEAT